MIITSAFSSHATTAGQEEMVIRRGWWWVGWGKASNCSAMPDVLRKCLIVNDKAIRFMYSAGCFSTTQGLLDGQ